jgi:integrase
MSVGYGDRRITDALRPLEVRPVDQVSPLRRSDLLRIVEALLVVGDLRAVRDAALLLVGWAAALRPGPLGALRWGDLSRSDHGSSAAILRVREDKGSSRVVGLTGAPVEALARWAHRVTVAADRPMWAAIDRHGGMRPAEGLDRRDVTRIVVGRALEAGLVERYSGHSLRAGYATEAELVGVPRSVWMRQTGHRSEAVAAAYVRDRAIWHAGTGLLPAHLPGLFPGQAEPRLELLDLEAVPPGDELEGPRPAER